MSEFKLTFGDASNNRSLSFSDMKTAWNKDKFNGKIQQSIFNLFDCEEVNGEIDIGKEKHTMFKELKLAAGADENLSEEEALAFLQLHGLEDATAQDLFDFFNIALDRPTEQKPEEQKVQEEPVHAQPKQEQKPPVKEEPVQKPQVTGKHIPEQEPQTKDTSDQKTQKQHNKVIQNNVFKDEPNPNSDIFRQTPKNEFFNRAEMYHACTDLATGEDKLGLYGLTLTYDRKSKSSDLHETQKLIEPQGTNSLSVGASTEFSKNGSFSSVSGMGQVGIGKNNRVSGAVSYMAGTGDNSSSMLNLKATDEQYLGHGVVMSASANYQNYQNGEINITKEGVSVSGSVPIPGVEDTILHGGSVSVTGEAMHSTTTVMDDSNTQGSTTLVKGDLEVKYQLGIPYVKDIFGDVVVATNISAFNMSDTDGTHLAGGIYGGPITIGKSFGHIPSPNGWTGISEIGLPNIKVPINDKVSLAGSVVYSDSDYFGIAGLIYDNVPSERNLSADVRANINASTVGAQYTLQQVTGKPAVHDANVYYSQGFNVGNNMQGKVTAEGGYNSETGAYGGVGVSFNIGNRKKK